MHYSGQTVPNELSGTSDMSGVSRAGQQKRDSSGSKGDAQPHNLDEQLASFETFVGFAHQLGALQVHAANATLSDGGQRVVHFFSNSDFPDARFGYRAKSPGEDDHEELWLGEELATGALHRIMRDATPTADAAGITWLRLDEQLLRADS